MPRFVGEFGKSVAGIDALTLLSELRRHQRRRETDFRQPKVTALDSLSSASKPLHPLKSRHGTA